ncbi:MAG TPA: deaminase [Gaiellaceae bacterium]|nr:deaminase [Gaiellaceae bacterium]
MSLDGLDLEALMREALAEAEAAGAAGEYPIGAVVAVRGEIVGRGRARHNEARSQLAHAELAALQDGGEPLWLHFEEAVLATTVEPCPLCLGAAVMADVPHIVFALHDPLVESGLIVEAVPYVRRHIVSYVGGVLEAESRALWDRYRPGWGRP